MTPQQKVIKALEACMENFPEQRAGQIIFNAMHSYQEHQVGITFGRPRHCEIFNLPDGLLADALLYYSTMQAHTPPSEWPGL